MRMDLENTNETKIKNKSPKELFKNQLLVTCIFILAIVLITISGSFSMFSKTSSGNEYNVVQVGELKLSYVDLSEEGNVLNVVNGYPTSDEVGSAAVPYRFSVENTGTLKVDYTVKIIDDIDTINADGCLNKLMDTAYLRYKFDHQEPGILSDVKDTNENVYIVYTGHLQPFESTIHEIRIWVNENSPNSMLGKHYHAKVIIEIVQATGNDGTSRPTYKEQDLNGCDPVLGNNLIPVTIAMDGTVTKASIYGPWYNYANREWANAVVLEETAKEYQAGETISPDDIESYFVWIPRYKYKIFNDGNYTGVTSLNADAPQTIEIEFETKDTPISSGTKKDEWLSHPAFQAFNTNGFWVGKFETGYRGATTTAAAQVNGNDSSKVIIKPGKYSWRNVTLGNAFKASYEYLRDLDSHLIKNTEWGAVAYLQHSIYGSRRSVRVNNNSAYLTGYASLIEPTCGYNTDGASSACNLVGSSATYTLPYNTSVGYNASTTGNITGIYDMSGGAREFAMGYNVKATTVGASSGITTHYSNFFTSSEWDKYYDKYENASSSYTVYNNRILGDATGELGPFATITDPDTTARQRSSWYNDFARMPYAGSPWFLRGYQLNTGTGSGIFAFQGSNGGANTAYSFRIVLAP